MHSYLHFISKGEKEFWLWKEPNLTQIQEIVLKIKDNAQKEEFQRHKGLSDIFSTPYFFYFLYHSFEYLFVWLNWFCFTLHLQFVLCGWYDSYHWQADIFIHTLNLAASCIIFKRKRFKCFELLFFVLWVFL